MCDVQPYSGIRIPILFVTINHKLGYETERVIRLKPRKEREPGTTFDVAALIKVDEKDLIEEFEAYKKTRERIEKTNERLLVELETMNKEEEKWENELVELDNKSKKIIEQLESDIRKEIFDWKRDQKLFQTEHEQLLLKLEDMEEHLEEKTEKQEQEQEKEISRLSEELGKLLKGDTENLSRASKLETEKKVAETEIEEAEKEEKRVKRDIVHASEDLNKIKKETKKFSRKVGRNFKSRKRTHQR